MWFFIPPGPLQQLVLPMPSSVRSHGGPWSPLQGVELHLPLEGCSKAQSLIARRISGFSKKSRKLAAVVEMWPAVCCPTLAVLDSSSSAQAGGGGG